MPALISVVAALFLRWCVFALNKARASEMAPNTASLIVVTFWETRSRRNEGPGIWGTGETRDRRNEGPRKWRTGKGPSDAALTPWLCCGFAIIGSTLALWRPFEPFQSRAIGRQWSSGQDRLAGRGLIGKPCHLNGLMGARLERIHSEGRRNHNED